MDKINIGESTLKDFGNVINEAADILNKGKVAFDNSIPDKTLQVLPYTGQVGTITPSNFAKLDEANNFTQTNTFPQINTGTISSDLGVCVSTSDHISLSLTTGDSSDVRQIAIQDTDGIQLISTGTSYDTSITLSSIGTSITRGDRSISFGGPDANNITISHTPTITNLTEWEYMSDYEVPVKKHIVESVIPDINNLAKLNGHNTFTGNNAFKGEANLYCQENDQLVPSSNITLTPSTISLSTSYGVDGNYGIHLDTQDDGDIRLITYGSGDIQISTFNGNIHIGSYGGLNISLYGGSLTMDDRAISEFKRVLGIS